MSVLLSITSFEQASLRLLDFGGLLRPTMGGPDQRLNRVGNRWAVDLALGEIDGDGDGRIIRQQLIRGLSEGVIVRLPKDGSEAVTPGSPVVNGAGQTGKTLNLRGFAAGYQLHAGQMLSIIVGGRRYVYSIDADATANGSGNVTVAVSPMLRATPSDGAVVEIAQPYLEGFITGDVSWVYTQARGQRQTVTIEEAA